MPIERLESANIYFRFFPFGRIQRQCFVIPPVIGITVQVVIFFYNKTQCPARPISLIPKLQIRRIGKISCLFKSENRRIFTPSLVDIISHLKSLSLITVYLFKRPSTTAIAYTFDRSYSIFEIVHRDIHRYFINRIFPRKRNSPIDKISCKFTRCRRRRSIP